jgi:hypothetical protein
MFRFAHLCMPSITTLQYNTTGTNKIQKGGVRGDGDGLGQALRGGRNRNRRGGRGSSPPTDRVLKVCVTAALNMICIK